jgi:hypothetical protein
MVYALDAKQATAMGKSWPHLLQLSMDQNTSKEINKHFGLKFIPHAFLLNANHEVV